MKRGFTLLEVVIALAILSMVLVAIFDVTTSAVAAHVYAKKLSVATLLARSKMVDLEQELFDKGFPGDDDEDAGDFSDEGWPSVKWRSKVIAPKTQGLSPEQLFSAVFNIPLGDGKEGGGDGSGGLAAMMAMFTGSGGTTKTGAAPSGAGGLLAAAGGGMMQQQFTMMVDQLTKAVREVHLTVTWKDGKNTESIDLVTHVVSLGPGSDRNGGAAAAQALQANGGSIPNQVWVRVNNGQVVTNPTPSPTGQGMIDPSDGAQLITQEQWAASRAGQGTSPLGGGGPRSLIPDGMGTVSPIGPGGTRIPGRPPRGF